MHGVETFATLPMWAGFVSFVLAVLALDLFVLGGKQSHRVSSREALSWALAWATLATMFGIVQWWYLNETSDRIVANSKTLEFFTGYLIELSLSVDNMFVFSMIFSYFAVSPEFQRRVLLFGVLGAIVMRIMMILTGVWLISKFVWLFYVFGLFLVITGIRMLVMAEHAPDLARNPIVRLMRKTMRMTKDYQGESFFVRMNGLVYATPMFGVLLLVEATDLVFAVDSIPAIFAVTMDPFVVFTSNIFAIMGLRALYFLLANMAERFRYLKYGLAIILITIGGKMLMAPWVHVPVHWSLGVVAMILLASIGASLSLSRRASTRDADHSTRIANRKSAESKRRP
ncbi:TerC family protein [Candidimonas sp. SYP-B2681]|uniref:TerC family protein n=1 Tax=Candidimonas sp. SYP-B2681 TaxID=2497686 RepID=UPI000F88BE88|nr:TerC family protein [Candidimonas sp. SYP-B2681]RTZ44640.1 TerC family protein [Candidimonas sp. SYP-B2681]